MSETIIFEHRGEKEYLLDQKPVTGTGDGPGVTFIRLMRSLSRRLWWLIAGMWLLILCVMLLRSRQLMFLLGRHYDDMRQGAATRKCVADLD